MKVKIKKLNSLAKIPQYAKSGDAGMDLVAVSDPKQDESGTVTYNTGLAMEIPEGHVGLIFPRSSVYKIGLRLSNSVGVIDSGYRGEILVKFDPSVLNMGTKLMSEIYRRPVDPKLISPLYKAGDRVAQIIIVPYPQVEFEEVDELSSTDRGEGGHGSTGK